MYGQDQVTLLDPDTYSFSPSSATLRVNQILMFLSPSSAPNGDCATVSSYKWAFPIPPRNPTAADIETRECHRFRKKTKSWP